MGFASGTVSFRRFAVIGDAPKDPTEDLLAALSDHAIRPTEVGTPEETEYGWCGGRHVLDTEFGFEHNVFGHTLCFSLRVDTNKVPSDLRAAYLAMEEQAAAAGNPSGFISKNQKREAKDAARRRTDEDLRTGRFRRSKLVPLLWDLDTQTVLCPASGKQWEALSEIFERTFGLSLEPISAGSLALRLLEAKGRRRDYEDARPTRFVTSPAGEDLHPEYPWVAKGPEPKDFMGNEFLLWLWHEADVRHGVIGSGKSECTVMIERLLDLDCGYGQTGRCTLRGTGPGKMPEAREAVRTGKVPRRCGMTLEAHGLSFDLSLNPETLAGSGVKLPEAEDAENPRQVFEHRIAMLRDLCTAIDRMFDAFLQVRTSSGWDSQVSVIRRWIAKQARTQTVATAVA